MPHTNDTPDPLAAGQAALSRAAWAEARAIFERALSVAESPELHDGLGVALWWLNEIGDAHHHRTQAYIGFKARGAAGRAARIACWLAREQLFLNGNFPAMQGWFMRAEPLVERLEPGIDRAWYEVLRASVLASPEQMAAQAAGVIATARQFNSSELEAFALAFYGQALVALGRVGEGMAHVDAAMTMATDGEVGDLMIISEVFCVMLSACELAGDLARSELWCRNALSFAQRYNCPFLLAYCRTSYGGLMASLGRWSEAEAALTEAIEAFGQGHRGLQAHAVIRLADLRASQGRIEEAEVMLAGAEDQSAAAVPLARLHLLRGEAARARAILEQSLPASGSYTFYQFPVLHTLIEVLLVLDDEPALTTIMMALDDLAARGQSRLLTAQFEYTSGRVSFHRGDLVAARDSFRAALNQLNAYEQSLLAGQVRLRMAEALQESDPHGAVAWARGALATFERLGAEHDRAQAAGLLRRLRVSPRAAPGSATPLTPREAEIAALIALGLTNRDIADRLVISPKTVEHHVGRILSKLGVESRVEVAALAAGGKLPGRS